MSETPMPSYNPQWSAEPSAVAAPIKPKQITLAFRLILAAAVLWVIGAILTIVNFGSASAKQQIKDGLISQGTKVPEGMSVDQLVDSSVTVATVVFVILLIVGVALYIVIGMFINKGYGWARIVGLVLTVLSLYFLLGLTFPGAIFTILQILAGIGAIVLCFMKPGSQYFADSKNYRAAAKTRR